MKRFFGLIICSFALHTASASGGPAPADRLPEDDFIEAKCEHLLHKPSLMTDARERLRLALTDHKNMQTFEISQTATSRSWALVGAGRLTARERRGLEMRIYGGDDGHPREIRLLRQTPFFTELVQRFVLPENLLPLYAWQDIVTGKSRFDGYIAHRVGGLTYRLNPPPLNTLELGLLLNERDNARVALSIRTVKDYYEYTLSIDAECTRQGDFSSDRSPMQVRTEYGWLCRVPLLRAVSAAGPGRT